MALRIVTHQLSQIYNSYGPWLLSEFHFCSISSEQIDGISSNFAHALTITTSMLRLLHVNFCKFMTEYWPMFIVRISFPLSIVRMN